MLSGHPHDNICESKYFKCPGFYCLPWRFVCTGQWECPGGTDEMDCQRKVCPGMFKCRNSSICISNQNLCDTKSFFDCPLGDDEHLCTREPHVCPTNCSCLLFDLSCRGVILQRSSSFMAYVAIKLVNVSSIKEHDYLNWFDDPIIFVLKDSQLESICNRAKIFKHLQRLDVSRNSLKSLSAYCFRLMDSIINLNLSINKINVIASHAFSSSKRIKWLDLSWNLINNLEDKILAGLTKLQILNLTGNLIVSVSREVFLDLHIATIVTENFKVCCVSYSIQSMCLSKPLWPTSCGELVGHSAVMVVIWVISITGLLLNITSFFMVTLKVFTSAASYKSIIRWLNVTDIMCCISIFMIIIADRVFADNYLKYEHYWRMNYFCYGSSILSLTSNFLSIFILNLLGLTRYFVIKNPLNDVHFLPKTCIFAAVVIMVLSFSLIMIYLVGNNQLPSGLCTLLGHSKKSLISLIVTNLTLLSQTMSCLTIPLIYYQLFAEITKSKEAVGQGTTQSHIPGLKTSIIVSFSNLVCWLPTSVLLFMTLIWNEYPYILLTLTTLVIIPTNILINPMAFVVFRVCKDVLHQ